MKTDLAILGAGFAGIGAGAAATEMNMAAVLFERDKEWGGLCGNFTVDGFRFDKAVHLSFTSNSLCKKYFWKCRHYTYPPEAMNYKSGFWVRHPVQNNLRQLPVGERIKIIQSFIQRDVQTDNAKDYEQWLELQFGVYFAKKYPRIYTQKYWATIPEHLNCTWCGKRIYRPSLEEVLRGSYPDDCESENVYYAKAMNYPKLGGYKNFLADAANKLDIRYGYRAIRIDTSKREIIFENGEIWEYKRLISTLPLPELVDMLSPSVPQNVSKAAKELQATSMALVSVGFRRKIKIPSLWFYVYDMDIPFARVHSPSMKSPDNVPEGCSSLQFEVYYSKEMPSMMDDVALTEKTLDAMEKMSLAKREDIKVLDCRHVRYANVIYYHGIERWRRSLLEECENRGIVSCGRFGRWEYLWSDQSFLSGYQCIKDLSSEPL